MPDQQRVHRFRDHAVAGVNWRQTRFVDEVPSSRVCALCRMIPTRTVLLPCSHALCQSCHAASSEACGGRCPMDQEQFEEDECVSYDLPTRKAIAFKVHCWNEAYGCEFEEALAPMLRHYENECTFHTVECLRCGEDVLHRELQTHYVAGCRAAVSATVTENASPECTTLTLRDVTAALEELKSMLRDANCEHLLLSLQSQMNELVEQIRNQAFKTAVIPQDVAAPAMSAMAQIGEMSTSTSLQEGNFRRDPNEEANTPSTSCSRSKKRSEHPEAKALVDLPQDVLRALQKTSSQDYPQHAVTHIYPGVECSLELTGSLSTTATWRKVIGTVDYVLTLTNFHIDEKLNAYCFADITVLHTKDAYFTVQVYSRFGWCPYCVRITFHGMIGDSVCLPPVVVVQPQNLRTGHLVPISCYEGELDCEHDTRLWTHRRQLYYLHVPFGLRSSIQEDGVKLQMKICHQQQQTG
ncbi:uncharacterized protein LOC142761702 isoform X3 [Rhipicephalus microplus]|uniref:uncharacterized protein LOC142761702 isoform X3 n=1 Tax=Rhipicephalus microplus TaxID=6941 RepID=UPI003F6C40A5